MLSCKEVGELVSQGLDRELSLHEKIGLKMHLFICKTCSCYQTQLLFVARSARRMMQPDKADQGIPPLSEEASIRIHSNIKQQMAKEQQRKLE